MSTPAELYSGLEQGVDDFALIAADVIAERGLLPVQWEIEGLIEAGNGPSLWTAAPERFKSWSALCVCLSLVTGAPLFGHFGVPRLRPKAIFLNLDAGRAATENRVARLGPDLPTNLLVATWPEWNAGRFAAMLEEHPGAFVVLDSFADCYLLGESRVDQGEAMRTFMRDLRAVYARNDCNGILIDHAARTERADEDNFSGSQQKKAAIRQGVTLKRPPADDDSAAEGRTRIRFGCLKMSEAEPFAPFDVEFSFVGEYLATRYLGPVAGPRERLNRQLKADVDAITAAIRAAGEPVTASSLRMRTGLNRDRALAALKDPTFEIVGGGRSTRYAIVGEGQR